MNVFIKQKKSNLFEVNLYTNKSFRYIGSLLLNARDARNFLVKYESLLPLSEDEETTVCV